jgi:hypothetical protein
MPGGVVETTVGPRGEVSLAGVVEQVASGTLAPVFRDRLGAAA